MKKTRIGASRKTLIITGILLAVTVAGALLSLYITGKVR